MKAKKAYVIRIILVGTEVCIRESPSPSRKIERDEQAARLRAALEKLPARQAEALHLVFYQDLALNEAAQVMRVSLGSVRQHYERGKARLRELLQTSSGHE